MCMHEMYICIECVHACMTRVNGKVGGVRELRKPASLAVDQRLGPRSMATNSPTPARSSAAQRVEQQGQCVRA